MYIGHCLVPPQLEFSDINSFDFELLFFETFFS